MLVLTRLCSGHPFVLWARQWRLPGKATAKTAVVCFQGPVRRGLLATAVRHVHSPQAHPSPWFTNVLSPRPFRAAGKTALETQQGMTPDKENKSTNPRPVSTPQVPKLDLTATCGCLGRRSVELVPTPENSDCGWERDSPRTPRHKVMKLPAKCPGAPRVPPPLSLDQLPLHAWQGSFSRALILN